MELVLKKIMKMLHEVDFMRVGASSRFNPEYEIPDHLKMSQNPKRLYKEGKQPPVAEDSDSINVCPAYRNLISTSDGQP